MTKYRVHLIKRESATLIIESDNEVLALQDALDTIEFGKDPFTPEPMEYSVVQCPDEELQAN
jgi:hypothetical protein